MKTKKKRKFTKANSFDNENITFSIFDARRLIKEFLKKKRSTTTIRHRKGYTVGFFFFRNKTFPKQKPPTPNKHTNIKVVVNAIFATSILYPACATSRSLHTTQLRMTCSPTHQGWHLVLHKEPFWQCNTRLDQMATHVAVRL